MARFTSMPSTGLTRPAVLTGSRQTMPVRVSGGDIPSRVWHAANGGAPLPER
ncbi:MAG: hypothetical protein K0S46_1877 [Moraxellaceae bacterium]|jgi:hypothetical protein|nr:hypothetical protein [Moraxellaceae bacterium]